MDERGILDVVMGMLRKTFPTITVDTDFQKAGADSQTLLDVIVYVEENTGSQFDPDAFDIDSAITPLLLSRMFRAPP